MISCKLFPAGEILCPQRTSLTSINILSGASSACSTAFTVQLAGSEPALLFEHCLDGNKGKKAVDWIFRVNMRVCEQLSNIQLQPT